jgi:acyl-homoserine-lactone acylase
MAFIRHNSIIPIYRMRLLILFLLVSFFSCKGKTTAADKETYEEQAKRVTIIRDNYGIPHIYGKTDADAVFGLMYVQCEDDFKRVEMNTIEKLGRTAELYGEQTLYYDLFMRLMIDTTGVMNEYNTCEPRLKKLLNAYADGINYYLLKNPQVKPYLLKHFEPWYPLVFTDGSVSPLRSAGVTPQDLKAFYTGKPAAENYKNKIPEQTGSNSFAVAPAKSATGNALLYINPHVPFYFRPEVHMVSEEGLNAYGAVTWGQFFIYHGFNENCGWAHTSSQVDVADLYAEKITEKNKRFYYQYNNTQKPVTEKKIELLYTSGVTTLSKTINTYFTHHGPVMARQKDKWLSVKAVNRMQKGLMQNWQRTKAKNFDEFKTAMDLKANPFSNIMYADAEGNIAYWHGNFIPQRDTNFNWNQLVDGSITATEWKGAHAVDETIHLYNPENGWMQNCNSTPFSVAGYNSLPKEKYPAYMAPEGENFRSVHAIHLLSSQTKFTIDKLIAAGYDTYLSGFELLLPALIKAAEADIVKSKSFTGAIQLLKQWDFRVSENSVATTLAIEWGERLLPVIYGSTNDAADDMERVKNFLTNTKPAELLKAMEETIDELKIKFGKWDIAWGEINRYQRLSGELYQQFSDAQPSLPVAFVSPLWGMNKRYGFDGNSFVCAVEFGKKIKAKSLLAGGISGESSSKHFNDQAELFAKGKFKEVLFYKEDITKNAERTYHPGE